MKLIDALAMAAEPSSIADAPVFEVGLVCGFTPLHLQTFLTAHLRLQLPDHRVTVRTGLFGDVLGTLRTLVAEPVDAVAIALEWSDLDGRLGIRQLGGWSPRQLPDVAEHAAIWLDELLQLLDPLAATSPVVVGLPTLPLPPVFFTAPWQAGVHEANLRASLWKFAAATAADPRFRIVNPQEIDRASAPAGRLNVPATWTSGFPYQNGHAERLAGLMARAITNRQQMKGLITDLDDTLWSGIVGDDGVENISWDLDHHTQGHGLYQQFLRTLSEEGVLIAVASKNERSIVDAAFTREDLLLPRDRVFPLAVGWGSKAEAVRRVLESWNVGPDQVVFVDNNPTELEEVQGAHPAVHCVRFPKSDSQAIYDLLWHLRDLFGRNALREEDALRLESLRASAESVDEGSHGEGYSDTLLERADASLVLDFTKDSSDARAFELVCKTNQFNLNGRRPTERGWAEYLNRAETFLLTATYKDRFGALGKIAVMAGRVADSHVHVETWVMSCRAFARRIEHQCVKALFDRFAPHAISFAFEATPRNSPIARFLTVLQVGAPGGPLTADAFNAACPRLFHRVVIKTRAWQGTDR